MNLPTELVGTKINMQKMGLLSAMIIGGIGLIYLSKIVSVNTLLNYALGILGYVGMGGAAFLCFSLRSTIYLPTGSVLISKSYTFSEEKAEIIRNMMLKKDFAKLNSELCSGNGKKIEIIYSKDKKFFAYQFFKYVPYNYEPDSDIVYVKEDDILKSSI